MALPSSGPLSLNDIQTEFGGTNPIGLNEYYAGGGLVPAGTSGTNGAVPSSGAISIFNFYGTSASIPFGQDTYSTAGSYTFVVPAGVSEISAVCVGAGGTAFSTSFWSEAGGGGALSYSNNISVTAGESLTVEVGAAPALQGNNVAVPRSGSSSISRGGTVLISAQGGGGGTNGFNQTNPANAGLAANGVGAVRYSGGAPTGTGGGGAAGYAGNGGTAPVGVRSFGAGSGGSGASGENDNAEGLGGGGGGVGLIQLGGSGTIVSQGGSGGTNGVSNAAPPAAGVHGGGGGAHGDSTSTAQRAVGGVGGVRIIYGTGKSYPSNTTA